VGFLADEILVIDVEATCWEGAPPSGEINEIIQIGLCRLSLRSLARVDKTSILIRPKSSISPFCTNLTGITSEMLAGAGTLADALEQLRQHHVHRDRLWASWGDYDRKQFERDCAHYSLKYPFGPRHLNAKTLFSLAMGLSRELGLDEAYRMLNWKMEGVHHRGDDDAWNIAGVLAHLIRRMRTADVEGHVGPA
jgi:inhibitor of KinA sporulation pathway (predicted exonuclease)